MKKSNHPLEQLMQAITYKGVDFEVVERPDVLWVGCVDYAPNNTDESDIGATLERYKSLKHIAKHELINPDYGAAISINYNTDKPCGLMFAVETYTDKQDGRYDLFTQPGGLWLRVAVTDKTDAALLGRKKHGTFEYFGILKHAAEENGYKRNSDIRVVIEYDWHPAVARAEHGANYAYIPIIKA